jgi:hypothetical protein
MEIFIARAEQGLDVGGEFNIFFHSGLCRCLLQLGGPGSMAVTGGRYVRLLHARVVSEGGIYRNARQRGADSHHLIQA